MDAQHVGPTIVVGVDGSPEALRAVRWAAAEAGRRHATLRLVTAYSLTDDHVVGLPGLGYRDRELLMERARAHLAVATAAATEACAGLTVQSDVVAGYPDGVLAVEARHAELLVVGDRGFGRVTSLIAGSVAVTLAASADCPVVVVHERETEDPARSPVERLPVLVGVDGTPLSEAAIAFAFEAAAARGVDLIAMHTWSARITEDPVLDAITDWSAVETQERELLAERLAGWSEKYPDVAVRQRVTRGRPAHALLSEAGEAQLVVVGSRGHGEFAGLVLDSVSNQLVHRAPCPVVVVRATAAQAADRAGA